MKIFKQKIKYLSSKIVLAGALILGGVHSAYAVLPPEVQPAYDLAAADANSMTTVLITSVVAVVALLWVYSIVKKGKNV